MMPGLARGGHTLILMTSSQNMCAYGVHVSGLNQQKLAGGEENFFIMEELRLSHEAGRVSVVANRYITNFAFLASQEMASEAERPESLTTLTAVAFNAFIFSNSSHHFIYSPLSWLTTVDDVASYYDTQAQLPSPQNPLFSREASLPNSLYIHPSISSLISMAEKAGDTADSGASGDTLTLLIKNNEGPHTTEMLSNVSFMKAVRLKTGSWKLILQLDQMFGPFHLTLPENLTFIPGSSFLTSRNGKIVFLSNLQSPPSEQSEASEEIKKDNIDAAMVVFYSPVTEASNFETTIHLVQRGNAANDSDTIEPDASSVAPETHQSYRAPLVVTGAVKSYKEEKQRPVRAGNKNRHKSDINEILDQAAHLEDYVQRLAFVINGDMESEVPNPEYVGHLVTYTRSLIELRAHFVARQREAKKIINRVDELLIKARILIIFLINKINKNESLVTEGGLEGSNINPVKCMADICTGFKQSPQKLNIICGDEELAHESLDVTNRQIINILYRVANTYAAKNIEFVSEVSKVWKDLQTIISWVLETDLFDDLTSPKIHIARAQLLLMAIDIGDVSTVLSLLQLTDKQRETLRSNNPIVHSVKLFFEIAQPLLVSVPVEGGELLHRFKTFLSDAQILGVDTSVLENIVDEHELKARDAQEKQLNVWNKKVEAWIEEEDREASERQKKLQKLRAKRFNRGVSRSGVTSISGDSVLPPTITPSKTTVLPPESWESAYYEGVQSFSKESCNDALQYFTKALGMALDPLQRARTFSAMADCYSCLNSAAIETIKKLRTKANKFLAEVKDASESIPLRYPQFYKSDFFTLIFEAVEACDDELIESIRQAYRKHVEAIEELVSLDGKKASAEVVNEVHELLDFLIVEAEQLQAVANHIRDVINYLGETSDLRKSVIETHSTTQPKRRG